MATKLTDEIIAKYADAIAKKVTFESAGALVGISPRTARTWLRKGAREQADRDNGNPPNHENDMYLKFNTHVVEALSTVEAYLVDLVADEAQRGERNGWRAAAWLLERRFKRTWGPHATSLDPDNPDADTQAQKPIDTSMLSQDELAKYLELCGKIEAGND